MAAPDNPLKTRARQLGITLSQRDWIPSSRRAHECTEHARAAGLLQPFQAAVLQAYWSEGSDIHEWSVLENAATKSAIDPTAMRAAVEAGTFASQVDERVQTARALGIHAVPTFIIDDRVLVQGAQELDVFEQALNRLGIEPR